MTNGVTIPVEQYVLEKIAEVEARRELKREALEASIGLRLEASSDALKLQAKEYSRRLADLNNSHETAVRVQNTFATKEAVEREVRLLAERVGKLEIAKADKDGGGRIFAALWGFAAAVAVALLIFFASKAWP